METAEKRKPSKDKEETRIILLGPEPSIHTACQSTGSGTCGEGEDVKSIQTGRDRRRIKESVIVERDEDEYR